MPNPMMHSSTTMAELSTSTSTIVFFVLITLISSAPTNNNIADLLIANRGGDSSALSPMQLFGAFSPIGSTYAISGDVVQVFPYRACDLKRKGLDHTLFGHIAIVFYDELEPFIAGCVSIDNQAVFARRSGALGVIVGPRHRIIRTDRQQSPPTIPVDIPIVVLDTIDTLRLRRQLDAASQSGAVLHVDLRLGVVMHSHKLSSSSSSIRTVPGHDDDDENNVVTMADSTEVLLHRKELFRATALNVGLLLLLLILVVFITALVCIKIRWRRVGAGSGTASTQRDAVLRCLARSALSSMEIRKFEKPKRQQHHHHRHHLLYSKHLHLPSVFGSVTSIACSSNNQDRCSICLDEYRDGQELRVLYCGHEFHPKCVDPWLLSHRRCPLCQYDVVYKEYPSSGGDDVVLVAPMTTTKTNATADNSGSAQPAPMPTIDEVRCCNRLIECRPAPPLPPRQHLPVVVTGRRHLPSTTTQQQRNGRLLLLPPQQRRRRLRPRWQLPTLRPISDNGYSSDVSSLQDYAVDSAMISSVPHRSTTDGADITRPLLVVIEPSSSPAHLS